MTKTSTRQSVAAPLASAHRMLQRYLDERPGPDGAARIVLKSAGQERAVIVSVIAAHRPQDMEPRYSVHWEPEEAGLFPSFEGILTVGAEDDYNSFDIDLDGEYEPPLGLLGKTFDLVAGRRIADETIHTLLAEIQHDIEANFNAEEAAKP
jgi:hypothetical protein